MSNVELATRIIRVIKAKRFVVSTEKQLQLELDKALKEGLSETIIKREHHLDDKNIIDFLINDIGIEVKIKGSGRSIYSQVERYTKFEQLNTIILISSVAMGFPQTINGKDCYVINLSKSWL